MPDCRTLLEQCYQEKRITCESHHFFPHSHELYDATENLIQPMGMEKRFSTFRAKLGGSGNPEPVIRLVGSRREARERAKVGWDFFMESQ